MTGALQPSPKQGNDQLRRLKSGKLASADLVAEDVGEPCAPLNSGRVGLVTSGWTKEQGRTSSSRLRDSRGRHDHSAQQRIYTPALVDWGV